jgi:ketosteroid isomerase-like protein
VSAANVELLRPVYAEWAEGNFRAITDVYGEDLEWGWSEEFPDLAGTRRGVMGRDERLISWLTPWEHWRVLPEDFLTNGDKVVVLCRYTGRGKGSGVDVDTPGAHVWTIVDGRATEMVIYSDRERALEAAGI